MAVFFCYFYYVQFRLLYITSVHFFLQVTRTTQPFKKVTLYLAQYLLYRFSLGLTTTKEDVLINTLEQNLSQVTLSRIVDFFVFRGWFYGISWLYFAKC